MVYHERQRGRLCAKHTLNNLMQAPVFCKTDLDDIANRLGEESRELGQAGWLNPHRSLFGGEYDVNVLTAALASRNLTLDWHDLRAPLASLPLDAANVNYKASSQQAVVAPSGAEQPVARSGPTSRSLVGLVLNVPPHVFWAGRHWLAVRRVHDPTLDLCGWWNLDSRLPRPAYIGSDALIALGYGHRARVYADARVTSDMSAKVKKRSQNTSRPPSDNDDHAVGTAPWPATGQTTAVVRRRQASGGRPEARNGRIGRSRTSPPAEGGETDGRGISAGDGADDMDGGGAGEDEGIIRCICGYDFDDGFTIQCDECLVWQHGVCVGISHDNVPKEYLCERCSPRWLDVKAAKERQRKRYEGFQRRVRDGRKRREQPRTGLPNGTSTGRETVPESRRRTSTTGGRGGGQTGSGRHRGGSHSDQEERSGAVVASTSPTGREHEL
ncbi:Josephin-domain-containing protein, partial [Thamnocephalis sphaerospora]